MKNSLKKATKVALMLLFLNIGFSVAQPYGQLDYTNLSGINYRLSKGLYSQSSQPGYVMAGYVGSSAPNMPNFVVYRTVQAGVISNPSAFTKGYYFTWPGPGQGCQNAPIAASSCNGVDIIEDNSLTGNFYVAMANNQAAFFSGIFNSGNPTSNSMSYPFPNSMNSATSPQILELTSGDLIITGSYTKVSGMTTTTHLYIIKIDAFGNLLNSVDYSFGIDTEIIPTDIIQSPYTSNEILIVGNMRYAPIDQQGFVIFLNSNTLGINNLYEYGNNNSTEKIGGICLSNSFSNSFCLSTMTTLNSAVGRPGYLNFDIFGSINSNFDYLKVGGGNSIIPESIIERPNTYTSLYDIYLLSTRSTHLDGVVKLDPNGTWFSQSSNISNDFQYTDASLSSLKSMSFNNNGGSDEGLHIYGNSASGGFYLVQSYFNGVSDCGGLNLVAVGNTSNSGPSFNLCTQPIFQVGGPTQCNATMIVQNENVVASQVCGGSLFNSAGNNSKKTSVTENNANYSNLFPTIVDTYLEILNENGNNFKILDLNGRIITEGVCSEKITTQNIPNGVYFIRIETKNGSLTNKFIISH